MATMHELWQVFRDNELEICRQTDPTHLIAPLVAELRKEWSNITNKSEYINTLKELQSSRREAMLLESQARIRLRVIESLEARNAIPPASISMLRAYEDWKGKLQLYIDGLRGLVENIQNFQHEQDSPNAIGTPAGNERSREYTANLLRTTRASISDSQAQLDECKRELKARDVPQSGDSHGAELETEDEDGRKAGGRHRESVKKSAEVREDGVPTASRGVEHAAPGGAIGAGGGAPGGGDGDGRDDSRKPPSKPDIGGPEHETDDETDDEEDDEDAEDEDDDEDDDEGEHDDEDESDYKGEARETREEDYIPLYDESLAGIGLYNYDDVSGDSQGRRTVRSGSSLLDYTDMLAQEQAALEPGTRSQHLSQRPGAEEEEQSYEHVSAVRRRSSPRFQPESPKRAAGAPGGPDRDSSDSSDDNDRPPKDPPKGNGKRRESDRDDTRSGGGENRKAKKRRKDRSLEPPLDPEQELEALIAGLPAHVQDYYRQAKSPECTINLDEWTIAKFVVRLYTAFNDDYDWNLVHPLDEYFNEDGTEREEQPMLDLRRREFDREWPILWSKIPAKDLGLTNTYQGLYARLSRAGAWHVLPPGDAENDLEWFGHRVVEAEHQEMHKRWQEYEAAVRSRHGSAAAEDVLANWEFMLDQIYKYGGTLSSPPPLESSGIAQPSNPLQDREWLVKTTKEIGFDKEDIPGVWTFLSTLNTGGHGHAALWVKYDNHGKILEASRLIKPTHLKADDFEQKKVVKEDYLGKHAWDRERFWIPSKDSGTPREYGLGVKLASCQQAFNIITALHYGLYPKRYMYRLYMEYCRHGDLEDLIKAQKAFAESNPRIKRVRL